MGNVFYGVQSGLNSVVYTIGQYYDHPTDLKDTALCSKNQGPGFGFLLFQWCTLISKEYTYSILLQIVVRSLNQYPDVLGHEKLSIYG